jgi:lipid A 3-O-deacylase
MFKNKWFLFAIVFIQNIGEAYATHGTSISYGSGVTGLKAFRVSIQKTWDKTWDIKHSWKLQGYWKLSTYHMQRSTQNDEYNNKLTILALTPVFRFYKPTQVLQHQNIYIEFAIGAAQFNKRSISTRELGTNFQFEDRLGFGMQFGKRKQYDIEYRVLHFSNAYIGNKNHGINLQMLYFNYWFNNSARNNY